MTDQTPRTEALPRLTHGRHCGCTACRMEDWTNPRLAPCGMHGPSCPAIYDQTPRTEAGRMKVTVVSGVEGRSLYFDDVRVAGPKPWGGGTVIDEWTVDLARATVTENGRTFRLTWVLVR